MTRPGDISSLVEAYDRAGVTHGPDAALLRRIAGARDIVTSPLPRARDSARLLAEGIGRSDSLGVEEGLRELRWPRLASFGPPLPTALLWSAHGLAAMLGLGPGAEGYANLSRRLAPVVARLETRAGQSEVVAVTHGHVMRVLERRLRAAGWAAPRVLRRPCWHCDSYTYD